MTKEYKPTHMCMSSTNVDQYFTVTCDKCKMIIDTLRHEAMYSHLSLWHPRIFKKLQEESPSEL